MKLKYGNIPQGRYGAADGIVNVCLGKRYASISKRLCMAENLAHRVVAEDASETKVPKSKVEDIGGLSVWIVDGNYIRTYVDEEFTNFGQHYRFNFIPENELWIDKEGVPNEYEFLVAHLIEEHRLMKEGKTYEEAIAQADLVERELRRRQKDVEQVRDPARRLINPELVHKRLLKTLENGVEVWIVNGRLVRSTFNIDFTQGGHEYVYEFVPENEVWIDDDVMPDERGLVILHELHERNKMALGWPYSKAHADSSALEHKCRTMPDELHDALDLEGWA